MRRTRHVVLPVRSWQYIGLLIVSLACLTLGLVSRDREGHAGSLVGPELEHRAPHEMDTCPNLNPLVAINSCPIVQPGKIGKSIKEHEMQISKSGTSPSRSSRILPRDIRVKRVTRALDTDSTDKPRQSRFRTTVRSRDVIGNDPPTRVYRSRDPSNARSPDRRSLDRRSLNTERSSSDGANYRSESRLVSRERREINGIIARRQSRADRFADRRNVAGIQRRIDDRRDRRSVPADRRDLTPRGNDRRESREISRRVSSEHRNPGRTVDRRSRDVDSVVRRTIERRDVEEPSRRAARTARHVDRNNNLDRRSAQDRRVPHDRLAARERNPRTSVRIGDSLTSNDRKSLSRSMTRLSINDLATGKRERSVERNIERSTDRRSSIRSVERREIGRAVRRENEGRSRAQRSLDRATSRITDVERIGRSRRIAGQRDWRGNVASRDDRYGVDTARGTRARYQSGTHGETERRERPDRSSSRSAERNSAIRSRVSRDRDFTAANYDRGSRRSLNLERTSKLRRSSEARRTVPTDNSRGSERDPERRVSYAGILGRRRTTRDLTRSSERTVDGSTKSRERFRTDDRRAGRSSDFVSVRRGNFDETIRRNQAHRPYGPKERGVSRSTEIRLTKYPGRESLGREKSSSTSVKDPSRLASHREQRRSTAVRMFSEVSGNDRLAARWERSFEDKAAGVRTRLATVSSMRNNEILEYPAKYDVARQTLVVALCMVYGLSMYNGKKFLISSNVVQRVHRLVTW